MIRAPCCTVPPLHTVLSLAQPQSSWLHQDPGCSPSGGCVPGWFFHASSATSGPVIRQGTGSMKAGLPLSWDDSSLSLAFPLPETKVGAAGGKSESP